MKIRIRVALTAQQKKALRQLSATTGRSIADLVRESVDWLPASQDHAELVERAIGAAGRFASGRSDISMAHDKYLTESYEQ